MKRSYLNYAMSVIVARALPDIRDGLKPVHRRILYSMHRLGLNHKAKFSKSATVVGDVLGKYHPHGDSALYMSLVRMGQDFSMRYPLIWGQGNFGSIDGDMPAAMRYTEAKMTAIADEMLVDIDKDTVEWRDNFDGRLQEPICLPAKLPNLLLMGSEGIAVGMATKIPPHNMTEVIDAVVHMIGAVTEVQKKEKGEESSEENNGDADHIITYDSPLEDKPVKQKIQFNTPVSELIEYVQGPDFPTAGNIYGAEQIKQAYATGKGKVLIRGTVNREETKSGKESIVITEIPYQVNKANLVKKIADLVHEKKIVGISDLRDESDRDGMRVVVELKRDAIYKKILNNLYKFTDLQTSFPINMVALIDNRPQTVSLKTILEQYLRHRVSVIAKRSLFDLNKAKLRAHILEGLLKALDHIDEIVEIIKKAKDETDAKEKLMKTFDFSDIQSQAILDMQLKRLTGLERQKIEDELKVLRELIAYLEGILSDVFKILDIIKAELAELKEKFGDERLTKVFKYEPGKFTDEQLIENKEVIVTLTKAGYIKTVPRNTFKEQKRGGKGVSGFTTKEEDNVALIQAAQTHDSILFFSNAGKVYQTRVWEIPQGTRISKGKALVNVIAMRPDEKVTSILTYNQDGTSNDETCILMCTKLGTVKKTELKLFQNIKSNGIIAIKLTDDDELLWTKMTDNKQHVILATHHGKAINFVETNIRPTGRSSQGVMGVRLEKGDSISSMDVYDRKEDLSLLVLTENGIGKQTKINLFPAQKRGGKGVKIANIDARTGQIAFSSIVDPEKETLVITSRQGQVVKIPIKGLPQLSRTAKGVILMRFNKEQDAVASATFL
jgi:DNA gyrase subunit A